MGKGKGNKGYWIIRLSYKNQLFFIFNFNIKRFYFLKKRNFYLYVDWYFSNISVIALFLTTST